MRQPLQWIRWPAFLSAVEFLTIIPCGGRYAFDAGTAIPFYPLVGLLLGTVLVGIHALSALLWPVPVVALLDVIGLAVLTGALHLDGLADTADGLYGHRTPEQSLAIMKDSRVGAMGAISVIFCLAAKWAGIACLDDHRAVWLLLAPAYARGAILFGIRFLPYGRPEGGTAHTHFQNPLTKRDFWGIGLLVAISLFSGQALLVLNLGFAVVVFTILRWYQKKIQCVTGDMLGALVEVTEAALFLIGAVQWGG